MKFEVEFEKEIPVPRNFIRSRSKRATRRAVHARPASLAAHSSVTLTLSPVSVLLTLPSLQLYPALTVYPNSQPPTDFSPTIEVRQPNTEDKLIADLVRLGISLARRYPNESAAFALGFTLGGLTEFSAKRKSA